MAAFTLTGATSIGQISGKTGGDTYTINGGTLTIDQDSRYGANQSTTATLGSITLNASSGGDLIIDARYVRLISYTGGTGNVPTSGTTISLGSASGVLIGVWGSLNTAPTAAAAAMPATGYIKIRAWNQTAFTSGSLTGIGATSTGADTAGWIDVVGDESATITANRLNNVQILGDWFTVGTCNGTASTTYQLPSSGLTVYYPGVWVENTSGSGTYTFFPSVGSLTAASSIGTDQYRGKVCFLTSAGVLRFGSDGTNTNGFVPANGCRIRVPNILLSNAVTTARGANTLPNATLGTRMEFLTTGGGAITISKASVGWYCNFVQPYSVDIDDSAIFSTIVLQECASAINWSNVGVGQEAATANFGLNMSLCFAGGTISDGVFTAASLAASGRYVVNMADVDGITFSNMRAFALLTRGNATTGCLALNRVNNCNFTSPHIGVGRIFLTTCKNLNFTNVVYWDRPSLTTVSTNPMYLLDLVTNCDSIKLDGLTFGGLFGVQPYSGILSIGVAGCYNTTVRNLGTSFSSPLSMGGSTQQCNWTRATTNVTVTHTAHGLKANDIVYVPIISDAAAMAIGSKTVQSAATDTFVLTGTNAGASSGTLTYYLTMAGVLAALATGAAANKIRLQRCFVPALRTNLITADNSSKDILLEDVHGDYINAPVTPTLYGRYKTVSSDFPYTAQTSCYGTHWFYNIRNEAGVNTATQSWSRSTTTVTVTSTAHKMRTGCYIVVTDSSSTAAVQLNTYAVTATNENTFWFAGLNAGSTSGTLTYKHCNAAIGLLMNEAVAQTASEYTVLTGTPKFTSAGGLYMPNVNDEIEFTLPYFIHPVSSILPACEAVMAGGTIANHQILAKVDQSDGSAFGSYVNVYYPRAGGSGSSGASTFTVTDATGVNVNDYIWGTGIQPGAYVTAKTGNTITASLASTAAVSGVIRFNGLANAITWTDPERIRLKLNIKTLTANTAAITSLFVRANVTTSALAANTYLLDSTPADLELTGLQPGSEVRVYKSSNMEALAGAESSGTTFSYAYIHEGTDINVDIIILHVNYEYLRINSVPLTTAGVSIPIQQRYDRNYKNPS